MGDKEKSLDNPFESPRASIDDSPPKITVVQRRAIEVGAHSQIYESEFAADLDASWPTVRQFYEQAGASLLAEDTTVMRFSRGTLWATYLAFDERKKMQVIEVSAVRLEQSRLLFRFEYRLRGRLHAYVPPHRLEQEVQRITAALWKGGDQR